jgi:hypothetical protein
MIESKGSYYSVCMSENISDNCRRRLTQFVTSIVRRSFRHDYSLSSSENVSIICNNKFVQFSWLF